MLCALLAGLQPLQRLLCLCTASEPQVITKCSCCSAEQAGSRCGQPAVLPEFHQASDDCRACPSRIVSVQPYQRHNERPLVVSPAPAGLRPVEYAAPLAVPAQAGLHKPQQRPAILGPRSPPSI